MPSTGCHRHNSLEFADHVATSWMYTHFVKTTEGTASVQLTPESPRTKRLPGRLSRKSIVVAVIVGVAFSYAFSLGDRLYSQYQHHEYLRTLLVDTDSRDFFEWSSVTRESLGPWYLVTLSLAAALDPNAYLDGDRFVLVSTQASVLIGRIATNSIVLRGLHADEEEMMFWYSDTAVDDVVSVSFEPYAIRIELSRGGMQEFVLIPWPQDQLNPPSGILKALPNDDAI